MRLVLLICAAFVFVAYGARPVAELWGDPQIEMHIPRLAASVGEAGDGRAGPAIRDNLNYVKAEPVRPRKIAIFYDDVSYDLNKMYGPIYTRFTLNLLGHFNLDATALPISRYKAGVVEDFDVIFYVGTDPSSTIPEAFFTDIVATGKTVVWLGDNLYNIPDADDAAFARRYGFKNYGVLLVGERTPDNPVNPNFYDVVTYKGVDLTRDGKFDTSFSGVLITDPGKVHVWAELRNLTSGDAQPYILQSGNLWFVAGMPFNALEANTPYLAFCDLLHDILGIEHEEFHQAMIRLEDVHAKNPAASLRELNRFLNERQVPYSIAVIPLYRDPHGIYNYGVPEEIPLSGDGKATPVRLALQRAVRDGARIIMHGYSHQFDQAGARSGGVSAESFEFWDKANELPVPGESPRMVLGRLAHGLAELTAAGLPPDYFEMPHYRASPLAYRLVPSAFARTYQRVAYYSSELDDVANNPRLGREQLEQQYPFVIQRDYYGQYIVPENIGYLYYKDGKSSVDDLLGKARAMTVVRDGIASFFVHPFLFNSGIKDAAWSDLAAVIDGMTAMGYRWTNDPDRPDGDALSKAD